MKTTIAILLTIVMLISLTACGTETPTTPISEPDTTTFDSSTTNDSSTNIGKTATLHKGEYIGGEDIPVGIYILKCIAGDSEHGIVSLSSPNDNLDEDYPSIIYEHISFNEIREYFIAMDEGSILTLPFTATLTAISEEYFETEECIPAFIGQYRGGKDIAAGRYIVTIKTDDNSHGIIWLSSPSDNLDEEYPSLIYEHISFNEERSFYMVLEDGASMYIPCGQATITKVEKVEFNEDGMAALSVGAYFIGEDLPMGKYILTCTSNDYEHGIVWISSPDDNLEESYPSVLYENISFNEEQTFSVKLEEGAILYIPVPSTISINAGVVFD